MKDFKIFLYLALLLYIGYQTLIIFRFHNGPRIITVRQDAYMDTTEVLKGYKPRGGIIHEFKVKASPVDFWDEFFLNDERGNLACDLLKITTAIIVGWYIFAFSPKRIFSKRCQNLFIAIIGSAALAYLAYDIGISHTRAFWDDLYKQKTGERFDSVWMPTNRISFVISMLIIFLINAYRYLAERETGKHGEEKPVAN